MNDYGLPIAEGDMARRVRIVEVGGDVLDAYRKDRDFMPIAERIKAIAPKDVSLYTFWTDNKQVVMLPKPGTDRYYNVNHVGICSEEFDALGDTDLIPLHDKDIR